MNDKQNDFNENEIFDTLSDEELLNYYQEILEDGRPIFIGKSTVNQSGTGGAHCD